jgi:outer membrane receptor protein involved in Fe transport
MPITIWLPPKRRKWWLGAVDLLGLRLLGNAQNAYGTNVQTEKTLAGYAMANFGQREGLLGHFDGNIGVRVIRTRIPPTAPQMIPALANAQTPACIAPPPMPALLSWRRQRSLAMGDHAGRCPQQLHQFPPELNTRFYLNERRSCAWPWARRSIVPASATFRPTRPTTSPSRAMATRRPTAPLVVNGGNPNLKPISSWNFDASFEYYFGKANAADLRRILQGRDELHQPAWTARSR